MEIATKRRKRLFCKNHNNAKLVVIEDLPKGILVQILLKLPSKSLFCLGCVSKALSSTVDDHSFITEHNRLLVDNKAAVEVPQLMSIAYDGISTIGTMQPVRCVGSSLRRGKYTLKVSSKNLCFVFRNLFCFGSFEEGYWFLVNPLRRREVVRLPTISGIQLTREIVRTPAPEMYVDSFYGMGFDKTTYKLKIVCVTKYYKFATYSYKFVVHVLELGTASWREISSVPPSDDHPQYFESGVCACEDMHWLTDISERKFILSFDFTKEEFGWTPTPPALDFTKKIRLLTFRGSLAISATSSSQGMSQIELWVLKDYERKVWSLDYALDVNMFCESAYLFERSVCDEWEHGIYFCYPRAKSITLGKTFLDLRSTPVKCFTPPLGRGYTYIVSYTGSLLSLKNYENLIDAGHLLLD